MYCSTSAVVAKLMALSATAWSSCTLYSVTIFLARRIADALMLNSFNPNARSSGIIMGSLAASPHMPTMMPASRPQAMMWRMLRSTAGLKVEYR